MQSTVSNAKHRSRRISREGDLASTISRSLTTLSCFSAVCVNKNLSEIFQTGGSEAQKQPPFQHTEVGDISVAGKNFWVQDGLIEMRADDCDLEGGTLPV